MRPAARYAVTSVAVLLLLVLSAGASLFLAESAIRTSQHRWYHTLQLLTAHPARPAAGQAYQFYRDFADLRRQFGC